MKKNLCFLFVTIIVSINTNAQDITNDSINMLDSIRYAGTKVQIRYVPIPKEEPKPDEFYSIQLSASIEKIPLNNFQLQNDVYHIVNEEKVYIYLSGEYHNLNDAITDKNKLNDKKGKNFFIVKVIDNRKIVLVE
jgi:hypothetical protein